MKERPILFSAPMVRAILEGRKTMTRRVIKLKSAFDVVTYPSGEKWVIEVDNDGAHGNKFDCLYGEVGDLLWVRETFNSDWCDHTIYRADGGSAVAAGYAKEPKWKPSIFMPRWASRIDLEITNIRVERLNDISEEDAKSEGLASITKDGYLYKYGIPDKDGLPGNDNIGWAWEEWEYDPVKAFLKLWESINGAGSWEANPFVWVIEFNKVC